MIVSFGIHFFEEWPFDVGSFIFATFISIKSSHFLPNDGDNTFLASALSLLFRFGDNIANGPCNLKNIRNLLQELLQLVDGSDDSEHIDEKFSLKGCEPDVFWIVFLSFGAVWFILLSVFGSVRMKLWRNLSGSKILWAVNLRGILGRNGCLERRFKSQLVKLLLKLVLGIHVVLGPDIFHPLRHFTFEVVGDLFLKLVDLDDELRPFSKLRSPIFTWVDLTILHLMVIRKSRGSIVVNLSHVFRLSGAAVGITHRVFSFSYHS